MAHKGNRGKINKEVISFRVRLMYIVHDGKAAFLRSTAFSFFIINMQLLLISRGVLEKK